MRLQKPFSSISELPTELLKSIVQHKYVSILFHDKLYIRKRLRFLAENFTKKKTAGNGYLDENKGLFRILIELTHDLESKLSPFRTKSNIC